MDPLEVGRGEALGQQSLAAPLLRPAGADRTDVEAVAAQRGDERRKVEAVVVSERDDGCVAVERDALRALLFEDGPLSDLVLSTFIGRRTSRSLLSG